MNACIGYCWSHAQKCKCVSCWVQQIQTRLGHHAIVWPGPPLTAIAMLQIKVEAYPGEAKKKPAAQGKKKGAAAGSKKQGAEAGKKKQGSEEGSNKESPKTQAA